MVLSCSRDIGRDFCMPFFNMSFFSFFVSILFSRYYSNSSINYFIQIKFIFLNKQYLFLNYIANVFGLV